MTTVNTCTVNVNNILFVTLFNLVLLAFLVSSRIVINDQPGRLMAIFLFAPTLIWKGVYRNDIILCVLGVSLLIWDLYWVIFKKPVSNK